MDFEIDGETGRATLNNSVCFPTQQAPRSGQGGTRRNQGSASGANTEKHDKHGGQELCFRSWRRSAGNESRSSAMHTTVGVNSLRSTATIAHGQRVHRQVFSLRNGSDRRGYYHDGEYFRPLKCKGSPKQPDPNARRRQVRDRRWLTRGTIFHGEDLAVD